MLHRPVKWLASLTILFLSIMLILPVYAQDDTITPDNPIVVDLSAGGSVDLVYDAASGETVTITARSINGDVDTKLELYDEAGRLLTDNDDAIISVSGLGSTDSAIGNFDLPGAGTYTIHVTSFDGLDTGLVEVTLTSTGGGGDSPEPVVNSPSGAFPGDGKVLFAGDTLKIYVEADSPIDLVYVADSPQTISVYAVNMDRNVEVVDTVLEVLGADGGLLAENDDLSSDSYDAGIENLQLSTAGEYTIRLSTFEDSPSGGVEVTLSSSAGGALVESEDDCSNVSLEIGETISASISGSSGTELTFCGTAGQVVNIIAIATDPPSFTQDLYMVLYDPDGDDIAEDDDGFANSSFDSAMRDLTLPATGVYTVEITSNDGLSGAFNLSVEEG